MSCQIKIVSIIILIFILEFTVKIKAQEITNDTATRSSNSMDAADLFRMITKHKATHKRDTIKNKSLGPFYTPLPYPGYAMVTGEIIGFASNVSFYTHHSNNAKISSILNDNVYSQYKQFISIINSNIWLDNENYNLTGDWRFYKFPTNTFGLGSKTTLNDADAVDYSQIRIYEVILRKMNENLFGGIGWNIDYHWNITETKSSPDIVTDFDKYGFKSSSVSSGITLNLKYDDRVNSNNPDQGTYASFQIRNNLKAIGSNSNWQSVVIDARHYIRTSEKSGNVLAFWNYDWLTLSGIPPYFDLPATGLDAYNNTARGYVEGRFRGRNIIYAEAEYRFRLLRNGFLGGVLFTNASTLTEWPGNKFEKINPGNGFGLRINMNKSSNTNLCIDYGFGTGGSRGFVFNLNEVF